MSKYLIWIFFVTAMLIFSCCACPVRIYAQSDDFKFEGFMSAGLNSDGWEWSIGAAWFPIRYLGVKAAIGVDSEMGDLLSQWNGDYDYFGNTDDYCARFQFCPSLEMRSPSLIYFNSQDIGIQLFASPGLIMSPRASGARSGEWLYWNMRVGLMTVLDERCTVQLGYGCSNFNLYAGAPISHYGYDDEHRNIHSVFVTFGYKF